MDLWHHITNWLDHNRNLLIGLALAIAMTAWLVGCEITTASLRDETKKVSVRQLEAEIAAADAELSKRAAALQADAEALETQIDIRLADIRGQEAKRAAVLEFLGTIAGSAATGGITAPSAIGSLVTLAGVLGAGGAILDNRRKDRVISKLKNGGPIPG